MWSRSGCTLRRARAPLRARDAGFIRLQDLADALIDFYTVTIEWNVAAGHHHTGASGGDGMRD